MCMAYDLSLSDCILTTLTIPLSFMSLKYLNVKRSPMTVFLLIYLFCSFSFVAFTKFYPLHTTLNPRGIHDQDFVVMASYSIKVLLITFCSIIIANNIIVRKEEYWRYDTFINPTYLKINLLIFFLTSSSVISLIVGIGQMGRTNTQLPFHLAGVIQFVRVEVAPFLALLFYMSIKKEQCLTYNNRKKMFFLAMFFCWTVLETYVRISKSAIAYEFLPILIYEIIENSKTGSLRRVFVKLVPFFIFLVAIFFIVENVRKDNDMFEIDNESTATYNDHFAHNPIVRPYTRFFINGHHFLTSYHIVDQNSLFDFSNMSKILMYGGAARYKTFIIDRYPLDAIHSSGSTYIIDALMCGGYGLSYVFIILLVHVCVKVDQLINSKMPLIMALVLALFVFKYIIAGLSVSIIVDPMSINGILVTLFLMFVFNINKKEPAHYDLYLCKRV